MFHGMFMDALDADSSVTAKMEGAARMASDTHRVEVYIAGDLHVASQALREIAIVNPMCVALSECDFIFTGGLESGMRISIVNYPRFPKSRQDLVRLATEIAETLIVRLCQTSALVVSDAGTTWISRRKETTATLR